MNNKEFGIYVHIPFCAKKCAYCDFISFSNKQEMINDYIQALKKEIEYVGADLVSALTKEITTIYIGGGTPSFIESKYIVDIIKTIKENFVISKDAEITIEVNPGTVTKEKLQTYVKCGINRISIGLQSANNAILNQIGRIHTYEQFLSTFNLAREVGFKNINVDLMLALPAQTIELLQDSVEKVISLKPEHISVYSLILEENTKLYNLVKEGKLNLPNDDTERKMYWQVKNTLEQNGYSHYEISNFALEGYESKHNLNCWNQEEYIGYGTAAHSYINGVRYSNAENIETYIKKSALNSAKVIHEVQNLETKKKEYMMLGLRKIEGIKISEFKNKFIENPLFIFRKELDKLVKKELIEIDVDSIKLSNKGLDFANLVWEEFV